MCHAVADITRTYLDTLCKKMFVKFRLNTV